MDQYDIVNVIVDAMDDEDIPKSLMAEWIGVSRKTFYRWISISEIPLSYLVKICEILRLRIEVLQ